MGATAGRRMIAVAVGTAVVVGCVACSMPTAGTASAGSALPSTAATGTVPRTSVSAARPNARPTATSAATHSNQVAFGEAQSWPNGLQITVAPATSFTPGDSASARPAAAYFVYDITIVNNGTSDFQPALLSIGAQSGSREAEPVFDYDKGYSGTPGATVFSGKQLSFDYAFGVADPNDVTLEIQPDFDSESRFWSTAVRPGAASSTPAPTTSGSSQSADRPSPSRFGDTYTWPGGLQVTVSTPTPFTPTSAAIALPATAYLRWQLTVVNNTGKEFDGSLFLVNAQSGGRVADQVFDDGLDGGSISTLANGQQAAVTLGFGVADPNNVTLEVAPDLDLTPAVFTT